MIINDKIYGEYTIDGILEELINSPPVQRLKGIHQGGAGYLVNEKWNVTRYEHSIGVMLLIKRLGGTLEEQIAGLLHDVSHTSFSHVIDIVFKQKDEDFHEQIFQQVIQNSEIPNILTKHGYDYKGILLDHSKWKLLEQPAPELCADRIDYTFRDQFQNGTISLKEIDDFLDELIIINGIICLSNIDMSEWFVKVYYQEVIDFFLDPLNLYVNDTLAHALKTALDQKVINLETLLKTDEEVLNLLRSSKDPDLKRLINRIHGELKLVEDPQEYDYHYKTKVRLIDPSVYYQDRIVRSSKLSNEVYHRNTVAKARAEAGMFIKVID